MNYKLTDTEFHLDNPQDLSGLYMPLVNEKVMSCITPDGHGDNKISQDCFFLEPVSIENLHSSMSTRNFWCIFDSPEEPWSAFGYSVWQQAKRHTHKEDELRDHISLAAGPYWQEIKCTQPDGFEAAVLSFCPVGNEGVELMTVTLRNGSDEAKTFTPVAAVPVYARGADHIRDHRHVTSLLNRIRVTPDGVVVTPSMAFDERGHHKNDISYGVYARGEFGEKPVGAVPTVEDYIGNGGNFLMPGAIFEEGGHLSKCGDTFDGCEAMGALWFDKMTLEPGESHSYVVVLSYNDEGLSYLDFEKAGRAFEEMKIYWNNQKIITCHTGQKDFDTWMAWVSLQPHLRRIYGCSFLPHHDYGRGGRGWRDLWQDCLSLILIKPEMVRNDLKNFFAGVRVDGTNATIIGSKPGEFVADRNSIVRVWMDHAYWPFRTVGLYLEQTGDYAFLFETQPYFRDKIMNRGGKIDENYIDDGKNRLLTKSGNIYQGTLLEHILLQHLAQFYDVGEHNHMRLHGADWNDALDMAAKRGESVAFTAAYSGNFKEMASLCRLIKDRQGVKSVRIFKELARLLEADRSLYEDVEKKNALLLDFCNESCECISGEQTDVDIDVLADTLESMGQWIGGHIRAMEFVHDNEGESWFNGYYNNHGEQAEGMKNGEARMMLTGQVFTILSGTAADEQVEKISRAAEKYLYKEAVGGYCLNTDFKENNMDMGRMFGFAYGHKENGAVFCHMSVMYAYALYSRGFVEEGYKALAALYHKAVDFETSCMYPGIPEYFTPRGQGVYSYLTGAGSWMVLTVLTQMYGVRGKEGNLLLNPKLLAKQFDSEGLAGVRLSFAGKLLEICYENKKHKEIGDYDVEEIFVNGRQYFYEGSHGVIEREYIKSLPSDVVNEIRVILD